MNYRLHWCLIALMVIGVFVVSCAAPAPTAQPPTVAPSTTALPKATAVPATASAPATATAVPATLTTAPSMTSQPATATLAPTATRTATAIPTSSPTVRSATATVASTTAPAAAATSASGSGKVDMNAILPPGKGQTLLLNNCTSCHSFVCSVKGQRSVDYWQTIKLGHRERVSSLSDDEFNTLFSYLAENFNDKKPVPELPPALADLGCSAQ